MYTNAHRTSLKTKYISANKLKRLMLFKGRVALHRGNTEIHFVYIT
jgi:hypothetical protein